MCGEDITQYEIGRNIDYFDTLEDLPKTDSDLVRLIGSTTPIKPSDNPIRTFSGNYQRVANYTEVSLENENDYQ